MQTHSENIRRRFVTTSLLVLLTVTSFGLGDVFTSSNKIIELAASEGSMLDALNTYIRDQNDSLVVLSQFLSERSKAVHLEPERDHRQQVEHPNGAYFLIKHFKRWHQLTQTHPGLATQLTQKKLSLPDDSDYKGSLSSLIRLQRVYRLSHHDMYNGNYSGYLGPPLNVVDAFLLGRQAFMDEFWIEAIEWLQLAVDLMQLRISNSPAAALLFSRAASLLGRAYIFLNNKTKAQEMLDLSKDLEPNGGDVVQLKKDLEGEAIPSDDGHSNQTWHHYMSVLCLRPKEQRVEKTHPWHVCRYRAARGLPYLRYKEEILSLAPFVSLFYNIVYDTEIDNIKQFVKGSMFRGKVRQGKDAETANIRTSDVGWVDDRELETTKTVSQRVKVITGLEVDQRAPLGPSSAEAMQVVNYGLGGHYDAHMDPLENPSTVDSMLQQSGNRIATFLMYLTDVEKGGGTVFLNSAISVSPIKGMALFWYNYAPAMEEQDELTRHAGCPVLIGQKWIANKWLWTYGNTFRRPCGPHPESTQLDVERILTHD